MSIIFKKGFSVGGFEFSPISGLIFPSPKPIAGRSLGDLAVQTSKEGVACPIVWGIARPIAGNVIAVGPPVIVEVESDQGGKGFGQQTVIDQKVFRTYAIRVCEGVVGYRRIWRNSKLVYDARGNEWGDTNNPIFLQTARLFSGSYTQLPSADLEAVFGVGNVPGHRGTAFMVMVNEDLTDSAGAIPQWLFEVSRCAGYFLTSRVYPLEDQAAVNNVPGVGIPFLPKEAFDSAIRISGGLLFLDQPFVEEIALDVSIDGYLYEPPVPEFEEAVDASFTLEDGLYYDALLHYEDWPDEGIDATGGILISGTLT